MIRLRTLGQLALEKEGARGAPPLPQPKRLALLIHLATAHPSASCARDTLLALLWPELDEAHARTALRQALHGLRRALGANAITGAGDERVGVDPTVVWCDSVAFGDSVQGDPAAVLALYRGPFLDGFHVSDAPEFERWVERERRRLELEAVSAARRVADDADERGDDEAARRWSERAVELAPYDEVTFRHYLEILERQSDAAAAVQAYAAYERRMEEDLGLAPSPETVALVERIRETGVNGKRSRSRAGVAAAATRGQPVVAPLSTSPGPAPIASSEAEGGPEAPRLDDAGPRAPRWVRRAVEALAVLAVVGAFRVVRDVRKPVSAHQRTSVAVLPFRSLSPDSSQAYFAPALRDEILDRLARVSSLRVVGRTSVAEYADGSRPLRAIAADLGVGRVVEGSVEITAGRLRVWVQLLDPSSGGEVWSERYDRTLDDAFAVQSEIATRIAAAVGVTLSGSGSVALGSPPPDAAAYRLYLQGLDYARRPARRNEDDLAAQQLLERALALDSTFGPAHAQLSIVRRRSYHHYGPSPEGMALADEEADAARRFAPDLPETHEATGDEYLDRGDYRGALSEFRAGVRGAPNDADLWQSIGFAYRVLGEWDSVFVAFDRARALDPRAVPLLQLMGDTYHYLHRYREAIECYRQALALAPDFTQAHLSLAWSYILWKGQIDTLKAVLASAPEEADPGFGGGPLLGQRIAVLFAEGRADSVLTLLRGAQREPGADPRREAGTIAQAETLLGDTAAARAAYEQEEALVDSLLAATPDDVDLHVEHGVVLGALGRRAEALREADFLERTGLHRKDRSADGWLMQARAMVLAQAGDTDDALVEIERALSHPSGLSVWELQHSVAYAPIRGDPRFQALLTKYANPEAGG